MRLETSPPPRAPAEIRPRPGRRSAEAGPGQFDRALRPEALALPPTASECVVLVSRRAGRGRRSPESPGPEPHGAL